MDYIDFDTDAKIAHWEFKKRVEESGEPQAQSEDWLLNVTLYLKLTEQEQGWSLESCKLQG